MCWNSGVGNYTPNDWVVLTVLNSIKHSSPGKRIIARTKMMAFAGSSVRSNGAHSYVNPNIAITIAITVISIQMYFS